MSRRIGIFSGTFDPFHIAHLEVCLVAKAALELETVVVLIEKSPARKQQVTEYNHRLAMIDLAIQEYPSIRLLEVEHDNITIDTTLPLLDRHFDNAEYWYIAGSDVVPYLEQWQNVEALFLAMHLCIVLRNNNNEAEVMSQLKNLKKSHSNLVYRVLPEVWSDVSSSKIRHELAQTGTSPHLHQDVINYIQQYEVY